MRSRQAVGKTGCHRITAGHIHDRNWKVQLLHNRNGCALHNDQAHRKPKEVHRKFRDALDAVVAIPVLNYEIATLLMPEFGQSGSKCIDIWSKARGSLCGKPTDAGHGGRALGRDPVRETAHHKGGGQ